MNRERLMDCIRSGRIMHAVLFTGPEGSGRHAMARDAAATYLYGEAATEKLENCPDYMELNAPYSVELIRTMTDSMAAQAFSHGRRVFCLLDAHLMNDSAQNALLKSLEEPPENTLVLLAGSETGLLPTIRSRTAIVRLGASGIEATAAVLIARGVEKDRAHTVSAWADGVLGMAEKYLDEQYIALREQAGACLETALFGGSPFPIASAILKLPVWELREKQRQDAVNAALLIDIFSSILRDALMQKLGAGIPLQNPNEKKRIERIAASFTTARIRGIINILSDGHKRLAYSASASLTVDTVLAALFEKEK